MVRNLKFPFLLLLIFFKIDASEVPLIVWAIPEISQNDPEQKVIGLRLIFENVGEKEIFIHRDSFSWVHIGFATRDSKGYISAGKGILKRSPMGKPEGVDLKPKELFGRSLGYNQKLETITLGNLISGEKILECNVRFVFDVAEKLDPVKYKIKDLDGRILVLPSDLRAKTESNQKNETGAGKPGAKDAAAPDSLPDVKKKPPGPDELPDAP